MQNENSEQVDKKTSEQVTGNRRYSPNTVRLADLDPFGEVISEYNAYHWQNGVIPDYLFNAKELDEESGMYYYSARYYAPPTFISRDPLFEKYPFMSPYAYCANNPVNIIDPDGRDIVIVGDEAYQKKVGEALKNIYDSGRAGRKLINQAMKSGKSFVIADTKGLDAEIHENKNASILTFDLNKASGTYGADDGGVAYTPETILAHELGHFVSPQKGFLLDGKGNSTNIRAGEVAAVEWENMVRKDMKMDTRTKYGGLTVAGKEITPSKYDGYYNLQNKTNYGTRSSETSSYLTPKISKEQRSSYMIFGKYLDIYLSNPQQAKQTRINY